MSYIRDIPYQPRLDTNAYDLVIKNLLRDIIAFNQVASNHYDYDSVNNFSYISQQFKNGIVVDNFGVDINNNNQAILANVNDTNFMITYRRDNTRLYDDDCRYDVDYFIFVKIKDCEPNYARLNSIMDTISDCLTNNPKAYRIELASNYTFDNKEGKKQKYVIKLDDVEIVQRYDSLSESHNSNNYLYSSLQISLQIIPII